MSGILFTRRRNQGHRNAEIHFVNLAILKPFVTRAYPSSRPALYWPFIRHRYPGNMVEPAGSIMQPYSAGSAHIDVIGYK